MRKVCEGCGEEFEAKRRSAKYCGATCRQRAHRRPAKLVAVPTAPEPPREPQTTWTDDGLAEATRRSLEKAGRLGTELGAAAMLLARRLDKVAFDETGGGVASLMKEYRATLAEATKDVETADDELDQIRGAAALKLLAGGA